jgi:hypothetical protein
VEDHDQIEEMKAQIAWLNNELLIVAGKVNYYPISMYDKPPWPLVNSSPQAHKVGATKEGLIN